LGREISLIILLYGERGRDREGRGERSDLRSEIYYRHYDDSLKQMEGRWRQAERGRGGGEDEKKLYILSSRHRILLLLLLSNWQK
jgi:hypothetical protein